MVDKTKKCAVVSFERKQRLLVRKMTDPLEKVANNSVKICEDNIDDIYTDDTDLIIKGTLDTKIPLVNIGAIELIDVDEMIGGEKRKPAVSIKDLLDHFNIKEK